VRAEVSFQRDTSGVLKKLNPKIPHSLSSLLNCNYLEKKERSLSQFLIFSTRMDVPKDQITALLDNQLYNSAQILVIIFFFILTICGKKNR